MAHEAYSPVGYIYRADQYCLSCIPIVATKPNEKAWDGEKYVTVKRNGGNGFVRGRCNCTECRLDRMATARGIDRYDEHSFDSDSFPKHIAYFNDLHCECGPEGYGYGPDDPEWQQPYCNAICAKCHDVIDGTSRIGEPDQCPVYAERMATRL